MNDAKSNLCVGDVIVARCAAYAVARVSGRRVSMERIGPTTYSGAELRRALAVLRYRAHDITGEQVEIICDAAGGWKR